MAFEIPPEKCKHMNIHRTPKEDDLLGQEISKVKDEKDIGVVIDEELSFDKHICEKVSKANSIFAVLRRTFRSLHVDIFLPLYKTLVRTYLDYASSVWAPYKKKYIDKIESVQKRATKQIPGFNNLTK
jgi:NAD-dependent dihydropyrimidine dehydrogenase PreA subunit